MSVPGNSAQHQQQQHPYQQQQHQHQQQQFQHQQQQQQHLVTYPQSTTGKVKVVSGYALQQKLGSGSFATVYKGTRVHSTTTPTTTTTTPTPDTSADSENEPETVAIKAITRTSEKLTKKVLQNLEIEISILRTYRHPNIVCMHNVQKTDRHFYLILEYCGGGDVQHLIRTRKAGRLTERLTRRLMRDLAAGLKFLWGQELIHRDIKPQNLLLTGALPLDELYDPEKTPEAEQQRRQINFPSNQFSLKIADFGFARHLQTASLAETLCGSPLYMAPEILQHHRYDAKADLWSVGTVLFEMIAGRPPFNGENHIDLLRNIQRKAVRLPPEVRVSKPCVNLLRLLLNRNPLSRAGFKEFFEACDAFVALGCEGVATKDTAGSCRKPKDLGTIHEDESPTAADATTTTTTATNTTAATNNNPVQPSDSLITVATTAQPPTSAPSPQTPTPQYPPQQHIQQHQHIQNYGKPTNNIVSATPYSTPSNAGAPAPRKYPNSLSPLENSPPGSSPINPYPGRIPALPTLSGQYNRQPWQQPQQQQQLQQNYPNTTTMELAQSGRRNDLSQSDDSGFVMVEHGSNSISRPDLALAPAPGNYMIPSNSDRQRPGQSPPTSPHFFVTRQQTTFGNPPKGMLSTSPGTGGLLMGWTGRTPRLGNDTSNVTNSPNRLEAQVAASTKLLATAEDVGRRAVSVAHLGDSRAYLAMRLILKCEEGSSLLSVSPMEGVEEEGGTARGHASSGNVTDDSGCTEVTRPTRRKSSIDKDMSEFNEVEEMPFAISPEPPAVALPSRTSLSLYNKNSSSSNSRQSFSTRPNPKQIRSNFSEALSCYLKSLKMLKSAVAAAQRVGKELESYSLQIHGQNNEIAKLCKRCEVTTGWLCGQFRGVLERADAANTEIAKLPSSQSVSDGNKPNDSPSVACVEELIYNHALAAGRDGAVKHLLGQFEAARSCYRSAGLLAETLLMEANVTGEDRKILEGYVDGFAARITELDQLMIQQQRMSGSTSVAASAAAATNSPRRGSGVIGLIGPTPR